MVRGRFQSHINSARGEAQPSAVPIGTNKAESAQRLQIGLFGLGSMVLLIGLATIIGNQADLTQESSVPEAAPTTEPTAAQPQRNPLADAGIVPDIPLEAEPQTGEGVVEDLPESAVDAAEPAALDGASDGGAPQ